MVLILWRNPASPWDGWNPINIGILPTYQLVILGPSTVCLDFSHQVSELQLLQYGSILVTSPNLQNRRRTPFEAGKLHIISLFKDNSFCFWGLILKVWHILKCIDCKKPSEFGREAEKLWIGQTVKDIKVSHLLAGGFRYCWYSLLSHLLLGWCSPIDKNKFFVWVANPQPTDSCWLISLIIPISWTESNRFES